MTVLEKMKAMAELENKRMRAVYGISKTKNSGGGGHLNARREQVRDMHMAGLKTPTIAKRLGLSTGSIANDLAHLRASGLLVDNRKPALAQPGQRA